MEKLVFFFLSIVYFVIFFTLLKYVYNTFVPFNSLTDILAVFFTIIVIIPASVFSANNKTIDVVRTSKLE